MKINAWQVLGVVLMLVAVSYLIYERTGIRPANPVQPIAPSPDVVMPTTVPTVK